MEKTPKIKTKDKIILAAIEQYNKEGVQSITSRHIAGEMGISHGNLDYHYKTKEDLLVAIYQKMRKEMTALYESQEEDYSALENFHLLLIQFEEFQYRYRFFNLDVLEITRSFPELSKLLQKTFETRKHQTEELFEKFKAEKFINEEYTEVEDRLQHIIRMTISFWLSQREVLSLYNFTEKGEMVKSIWILLKPYLTPSGLAEYGRVIDKYGYTKA
ncbi:DNA-binding transcriptional regulator, AcrR family [Algoriphagus locisalis]|uniref:DNA-binding transcriptional regulator, AcrR family n=1 Tax=Algoriphagus locisalis TaxID=305507 RepID=A0A1I7BTJ7_9BACT|nr:TetR/AcrR family transcriptional regulator [Algoriphagus locisalis]SFT90472.1 DNA-binding transcriptional regulator, AcrR family [Algoriphagus locisalis]